MTQTYTIPIQNMTCGGCAARVGKVLEAVQDAFDTKVNFASQTAQVSVNVPDALPEVVAALDKAGYPTETAEVRLAVSGLSCASCVGRVQKVIEAQAGVLGADVNLATTTATVRYLPNVMSLKSLALASEKAGYPAALIPDDSVADPSDAKKSEAQRAGRDVMMAAALTLPVFVLEMGGHMVPAFHHMIARTIGHEVSWIIQFVLTTAVLLGPGRQFFTTGLPALLNRAPTMNSLVALGAGAAWVFSTVALWLPSALPTGTRAIYFEAAAVIVTLILLGRWFEARAKGQTGAAIRKLLALTPPVAKRRDGENWVDTPVADLAVGDTLLIQPGARVPTDVEILEGNSRIDESMITGEPMQVAKGPGDALVGGSVNGNASLTCKVKRIGADTTLAGIIRMVQNAQGARLPIQALVDRVTLWFVPVVILVAVLTIAAWMMFGAAPALPIALVAGVSVLIIACPCAMGLATPTSIMVGTGRAAELGVLFRQGDALQSLSGVKVVAFDKTGTLTEGMPTLTRLDCVEGLDADKTLAKLAAVESHSEHPLAQAILVANTQAMPNVTEVEVHAGHGISATCGSERIAIGNAGMMANTGADISPYAPLSDDLSAQGNSVFYAAIDGRLAALLAVSDPIRSGSSETITALKSAGLKVAMITGDAKGTAHAVAETLGIEDVTAEVLPGEKMSALQDLRKKYGKVAFVGDGINDAPVLAEADVGIALGTGTDVAIETADVVLMSGDARGVTRAFEMSRVTLRNIKQNLAWAFGYNILLIPVAAGVLYPVSGILLSPGLAAGAMAFSSVFVLGNALRLRRMGDTL